VDSDPIVVVGDLPDRAEARAFVEDHVVAARSGKFARWFEPICARTWGLDLDYNAFISSRVMDVAERVGIPTNRAELCRPNVMIGFTSTPQDLIEQVARRNHLVLGYHYAANHDRLTTIRYPVQAWYATTSRSGQGQGVARGAAGGGQEYLDAVGRETVAGCAGSRLTNCLSSGLAHVLIVVDTRSAIGQPTQSIADLVAFMALAQSTQRDVCAPGSSIIDLMISTCPAEVAEPRLSAQDLAFLRALYSVNPELNAPQQRGAIVQMMAAQPAGR
jgi:hypothetical protein